MEDRTVQPSPPCARLGIIAPNGDFYPCAYCCHNDLSYHICTTLDCYTSWSAKKSLEDQGYVFLIGGPYISKRGDDPMTENQISTLRAIIDCFMVKEAEGVNWLLELIDNPEEYAEERWLTPPHDRSERELKPIHELLTKDLSYYDGSYRLLKEDVEIIEPTSISIRVGQNNGD